MLDLVLRSIFRNREIFTSDKCDRQVVGSGPSFLFLYWMQNFTVVNSAAGCS